MRKLLGPAGTPRTPGTKGPRSRGPGRTEPRDLEGPMVPGLKKSRKSPGLKIGKVPGQWKA